jgi:ferredoxin
MVVIDVSLCNRCGLCVDVCPEGAIAVGIAVVVNRTACQGCCTCVDVCPIGALAISSEHQLTEGTD